MINQKVLQRLQQMADKDNGTVLIQRRHLRMLLDEIQELEQYVPRRSKQYFKYDGHRVFMEGFEGGTFVIGEEDPDVEVAYCLTR